MRTFEEIRRDLAALGRPAHPSTSGDLRLVLNPKAIALWREELAAWRTANPQGEERYCLLLEELEAVEDFRLRQQHARRIVKGVGVPPVTLDALDNLKRLHVVEAAEAWLDGAKPWLVLGGSVGTGKSVAAAHALTKAIARRLSGAWCSASNFVTIVGGFSGQAEAERLKHVDVMVLDDLGTEHTTPFVASVFFEVLAARHENGNRTIITHNLTKEDLRKRLGVRLADRVANSCTYVECVGESMRGAA